MTQFIGGVRATGTSEIEIGAIVFDMDGLMLDTEAIALPVYIRAASECGFAMDDALFRRLVGRTWTDTEALLCEAFGPAFCCAEFAERCSLAWTQAIEGGISHKPGLGRLLDLLDSHRFPRAVATSTAREPALRTLELTGLLGRFEHLVTGDEVERGKPAPDIFLLAAQRLALAPERCLVLEDSHAGVRAAHAAGCPVIMVPDLLPPTPEIEAIALEVLPSLDAVAELLAGGLLASRTSG